MAYIRQFEFDEASGELRQLYDSCVQRAGYLANILKVQSQTPVMLRESLRFYVHLMKSPNALSAARREMLATVVSNINDCFY